MGRIFSSAQTGDVSFRLRAKDDWRRGWFLSSKPITKAGIFESSSNRLVRGHCTEAWFGTMNEISHC